MKIAVLPGDGIGPEIIEQAVKIIAKVSPNDELNYSPIGGAGYDSFGKPLPDETL